ncbi:Cytochrome c oxidase subunit III [marine gamma proteobacterium HTCC2207]|jgi:cytochrome c oxidase subunit 3|uniref:cytochrome-c oxidase n=1 Tax=gamma proteobacterium HTCC2207 TaxID=314287 RepID=Q1YUZ2_9GAMM|nr:Cytochrome c oxidase subunit III [marine gamma proteobacterium HTCC2207] [gamma proteobacterium HTCC2207]MBT5105130.1 cytochrome c oxidase subunit 3 [Porticoccaceae bacterium]MBT6116018.1 cytochrome c oxidase subunit 3 [Porticoccaceae bacterium]MDB4428125.1 cytochrome c oxidase subunit 3 [Porticoccaceae bacterium]MDG1080423.1 cytochrome c oxidase subunit 3 [Porticoccaceae bacterium]
MSTESSYYVPEQSKLPIITATGMGLMAYGAASWVIGGGNMVFTAGLIIMALVMFKWWSIVIDENMRGLANDQLKRSYVLGMLWFIFSEVMFFAAFFGALFYLRVIVNSWLGGDAAIGIFDDTPTDAAVANNALLWPGYEADWPPMVTPDEAANGANATFIGPDEAMSFPGWSKMLGWLPLWNTVILVTSSVTVHIAHTGLKNNNRKQFVGWLGFTVLLGLIFLVLQAEEYIHAYQHMGLTLDSGIYGTTFFMLTGFHGAHVTLGTAMLAIAWFRSLKGHFSNEDQFGFEAASWYWHFVDVVWILLFFVVYVFD